MSDAIASRLLHTTILVLIAVALGACGGAKDGARPATPSTIAEPATQAVSRPVPIKVTGGSLVPTTIVRAKALPDGVVAHAIEVAAAIKAGGAGCDEVAVETSSANETAGNPSKEQVSCDVGDESVEVDLYADHRALIAALPFARRAACFASSRHSVNGFVEGYNWTLTGETSETDRRLAGLLHAKVDTLRC